MFNLHEGTNFFIFFKMALSFNWLNVLYIFQAWIYIKHLYEQNAAIYFIYCGVVENFCFSKGPTDAK